MNRVNRAIGALFLTVCLCLAADAVLAQAPPASHLLSIHEDQVIPSKVEEYEKTARGLVEAIKTHNVPISYTAASIDDFTYIYFTNVENLAAVDKMGASFDELQKKMGEAAFGGLMKSFDACYPSHRNYLVRLRPDLSYKPEHGVKISDGLLFRHWDYYHIHPDMETEAEAIAKEWVALNEKLKTAEGYRLYVSAFGQDGPVFTVVQSAKSAVDFYTRNEAWMKKAGEEGKALMARTMKVVRKFESKDGMIRPELSASPQPVATSR